MRQIMQTGDCEVRQYAVRADVRHGPFFSAQPKLLHPRTVSKSGNGSGGEAISSRCSAGRGHDLVAVDHPGAWLAAKPAAHSVTRLAAITSANPDAGLATVVATYTNARLAAVAAPYTGTRLTALVTVGGSRR